MAYVRKKIINGRTKYYLVESYREAGKVKQRTIVYMGDCDTVEGAIAYLANRLDKTRGLVDRYRQKAADAREHMHPAWIERNNGVIPERNYRWSRYRYDICKQYWVYTRSAETMTKQIESDENRLAILRQYATD